MKTLYQASNALEAHMLVDVLKQQGFSAHLQGEHLQSAAGELPLGGLVRLMIDDEHYLGARDIIAQWEAAQPAAQTTPATLPPKRNHFLLVAAVGVLLGIGLSYAWVKTPMSMQGIDYNGDGIDDEVWTFSPRGTPTQMEADRNLDGKVDLRQRYDLRGRASSAESDDNFDGEFETLMGYRLGSLEATQTDTDGDGHADTSSYYRHGVWASSEYRKPGATGPFRVESYRLGKLVHADIDRDGDGQLDTRIGYSAALEPLAPEALKP